MGLTRFLIPKTFRSNGRLRTAYELIRNIMVSYGWWKSFTTRTCIDKDGNPIPWITYPCIDFLSQFDFSGKKVFEYGSGYSTLYWAKRAAKVVSVEGDKEWYDLIKPKLPSNCELLYSESEIETYVNKINGFGKFDVIVIDGIGESRPECAKIAYEHLAEGGIIVLDNSDLWITSASILRNNDELIQVDFTGFTPLSGNASTTSVFMSRNCRLKPLKNLQPHKSIAQPGQPWVGA